MGSFLFWGICEKVNCHHPHLITTLLVTPNRGRRSTRSTTRHSPKHATNGDNHAGESTRRKRNNCRNGACEQAERNQTEEETTETTVFESVILPSKTEDVTEEPEPAIEETIAKESIAIPQEPTISKKEEIEEKEEVQTEGETAECIDKGDQNLVEYKPQIGGQPNPFENDTPTEIDVRPVEDYIGEGEDRPGEGLHF